MVLIQGALFNFFTELRDFHVYSSCWKPYRTQKIEFKIDENNKHDQYAITGYTSGKIGFCIVRHTPSETTQQMRLAIRIELLSYFHDCKTVFCYTRSAGN